MKICNKKSCDFLSKTKQLFVNRSICKNIFFFSLIVLLNIQVAQAAITIQSISTTPSSCGNNGVATVAAISNKPNPSLFYEIIDGPYIAPIQNIPTFSSLFPGTYKVRVYDIDFLYKEQEFTITGNYQLPDLNPQITDPFCAGSATGKITATVEAGKGKAPFIWELISGTSTITQTTDVFNNIPAGNYNIKLTDACGNYQTRTVILVDKGTGLAHANNGVPTIYKIGCNSMLYTMDVRIFKERAKNPFVLTYTKGDGTVINKSIIPIAIDTVNYIPGIYTIRDTIPNLTYKDYLHGCIKDICGNEICAVRDSIAPLDFDIRFTTIHAQCNYKLIGSVVNKSIGGTPYMNTGYKPSLSLTLRDETTNALIDSTGCDQFFCAMQLNNGVSGSNYIMHVTDGCGEIFQKNITWPPPIINPATVQVGIGKGCLDSTAYVNFGLNYFGAPVTIQILSGPSKASSTKPGYEFSYPITYPKTFFANYNNQYSIKNMPAGTYTYAVRDTCGTVVNGTFAIQPSELNNMFYSYALTNGCAGDNILKFNVTNPSTSGAVISDLSTNSELYKRTGTTINDSLSSMQPGKYLLQITYGFSYSATITDGTTNCWVLTDTIRVPENSDNTDFQSHTSIFCNGIHYVEINADSSHGVAPYQYEISSGPTTFPLQYSNVFQLTTYGDYIIRIRDACGNSNARQISVDSVKFAPVIKIGAACRGNKIILKAITSSFLEYTWRRPDGSIYTGDSLTIGALSPADTGTYIITKNVSINGCTDMFQSKYHLQLRDVNRQTVTFCEGSSLTIGTRTYTTSDIYTDTLLSEEGCDSIRIITVHMIPKKIDTVNVRICNGDHIVIGSNTYNSPGFYKDSIQNTAGCYEITVTNLDVNGFPDTIHTTVCEGKSYLIGNHAYTMPGLYTDTLLSSYGCDSIVTTDLFVMPLKRNTITESICTGQSITIGTHTYSQNGTYHDTLSTATCDSIVTLHLTVLLPFPVLATHDTMHCFDEGPLTLTANPAQTFLWMPSGETSQRIDVTQAGIYSVTATDLNNCSYTEQIDARDFCETKLFVPTGFTPNGDGLHDDVEIFGKHFTDFNITIFNRWGEVIFISTDRDIRWDGTYRGELMPAGSYPWVIHYTSTLDPEHKEQALKGSITLVR